MIGIAICLPGGASIISGAIFPNFYHKTKEYIVPISAAIFGIGYIVMSLTHSFATQTIANILIGLGSGMIVPYILNLTSKKVEKAHRDAAYGFVTSGIHLGFLLAPFVQLTIKNITGFESYRFLCGVSAAVLIVVAVISFLAAMKQSKQITEATIEEVG